MAEHYKDEYETTLEDYEFVDLDDEADMSPNHAFEDVLDTDSDDDFNSVGGSTDTTASQARRGKDIQGIPWVGLQFSRKVYRETRLAQYKNYENLNFSHDDLKKECMEVAKDGKFYEFQYNTRTVKSTIVHFQLRNLVWATSKHDIYLMDNSLVQHWSSLTKKATEVLDVSVPVVPTVNSGRSLSVQHQGLDRVQVSTMCVKGNLLVAGGFHGEMVCKFLDRPGVAYCAKITHDDNAITNAVEIYESSSGAARLMSSNNDCIVRIFDTEQFLVLKRFNFPWAVNHTSVSPNEKLVVVVGDDPDGFLADTHTGKIIHTLKGHLDHSFASAWHPDSHIFATGNQDKTCRVWDVRNLSSSLAVLKGHIGAIRSLRFSSDGRFLAMAEPADFVHIFDMSQGLHHCQEIDIFGEIAGISFSPDTEALYIGVADAVYGSLLEYNRYRVNTYLDAMV